MILLYLSFMTRELNFITFTRKICESPNISWIIYLKNQINMEIIIDR